MSEASGPIFYERLKIAARVDEMFADGDRKLKVDDPGKKLERHGANVVLYVVQAMREQGWRIERESLREASRMSAYGAIVPKMSVCSWYYDDFGGCGCGAPEEVLDLVFSALCALELRNTQGEGRSEAWDKSYETLGTLIPDNGLGWAFWYALDRTAIIEHGGNVRGSWLTDKGEQLLKLMRDTPRERWHDNS